MSKTALQLVTSACYGANITPPSALVGQTASSTLQLIELFYEAGRELVKDGCWSQLRKWHTIYLVSGRSHYQLPQDFYSAVPGTHWDNGQSWRLQGPEGDISFNYRINGMATGGARSYREGGPFINSGDTRGQLEIYPVPGDSDQDTPVSFEYFTRSWLMPKSWVSGGTVGGTDYVNSCGNIYSHASGTTNGTIAPNMAYGVGQDGGAFWKVFTVTAYTVDTLISAGDYYTNGGNLYFCTVGGTTSGGPSGTTSDTDITDGTVTWRYKSTSAWVGQTDYSVGDIRTTGGRYYRCVRAGKSGITAPTWTATTVSDGTITWTHVQTAYEALVADTDLCLFDDELMILGLQWRFMRARGLDYAAIRADFERAKDQESGRLNAGRVISAAGRSSFGVRYPSLPESFDL